MHARVLITGAAGFIGSYLARELIGRGDNVVGVDNFNAYYARRAKEFNLDLVRLSANRAPEHFEPDELDPVFDRLVSYGCPDGSGHVGEFSFHEGDVADADAMAAIFERHRIEKVVHLAAMAGVPYSVRMPVEYSHANVTGTTVLLELGRKHEIGAFVFGSSSSVYGGRTNVPFHEDDDVDRPMSPYAATKRMGEILCWTFHYLYETPITVVRIFGPIYGPLQRPYGMAAQRFIKQVDRGQPITVYGDGSMARDSTYVDDEVRGLILAMDKALPFEVVNIGCGHPVSVLELADTIIEQFGRGSKTHIEKPATEVPITYADITRAAEMLGYGPRADFAEGIRRQIEVYRLMPDWYRELPA